MESLRGDTGTRQIIIYTSRYQQSATEKEYAREAIRAWCQRRLARDRTDKEE